MFLEDSEDLQEAKSISRRRDEEAIASGQMTADELRRKNAFFDCRSAEIVLEGSDLV